MTWAHEHEAKVQAYKDAGEHENANSLEGITVLDEPRHGGPLGVMQWTGPSVWSDAVLG